jgi:hypothetical protein
MESTIGGQNKSTRKICDNKINQDMILSPRACCFAHQRLQWLGVGQRAFPTQPGDGILNWTIPAY